jgi:hydrogenase nickel incorporation protein HypA/HybF
MHEMSLAMSIVDLAVETAGREGGKRVSEVEIEIGNMAGVMVDALQFCLEAAARTTIVEGAAFNFVETSAIADCPSCKSTFETSSFYIVCPDCGHENVAVNGGQDLKITSLVIED